MNSEKFAAILATIIGVAVLAAAFIYVPPGKPTVRQAVDPAASPTAPAVTAPPVRGPVVRELPQ